MANKQEQDKIGLVGMGCGQAQHTAGQEESGVTDEQSEMASSDQVVNESPEIGR
ncbi:hypothetical protein [Serratia marcescens]|uniref:hypothetical protein n=1 Tax=Serratia marcescens TaxID=615 RepID=UPI001A2009EF|nr:hypothetical protein [Serratia marcescens]BEM39921.1 hypothetical protein SME10J_36480 [Serratia marcescens]HAT3848719.1 hypothetical protein [Serratia marcescens]